MGALNDLASNQVTQSTTMPTWYDQAQQNVVNKAAAGAGAVPTLGQTVAGGAINQLSNQATNPFTQAQGTLNQIATGAANPWITDASGNVSPNTNTALGGLFQAQNQQLNQLLPNVTAPVEGANIASGNFGSLRGQTAVDKAKADALSVLNTAQMQAALQNQQTGVSAATGLGNVGSQGVTSMTNLGQAQQADPLLAASGLGKIVAGINAPTTVTSQTQLSPLNLAGTLATALGGSVAGVDKLLTTMGITGGLGSLVKSVGSTLGIGGTTPTPGGGTQTGGGTAPSGGGTTPTGGTTPKPGGLPSTGGGGSTGSGVLPTGPLDVNGAPTGRYDLGGGRYMIANPDGSKTIYEANGTSQVFDANGNPVENNGTGMTMNTDADGNVISTTQTNPDGSTSTYDNQGNLIDQTPAPGGDTSAPVDNTGGLDFGSGPAPVDLGSDYQAPNAEE